ncbi:hypothetical protein FFLO_05481 [Filobasidium floriforme]|uniref:Protein CPL1-like domain-containing protein n=1 Tax=Filobasidium floriforme TaxID=5210 RepID=A0A8K0NN54_9TREE|nr:hypothetical protein FFLO_05481 [Filobasidium floriforme]
MRFTTLFTSVLAAVSSVAALSVQPRSASSVEMSPRNLHEFASRQVVAGTVCATVGPVVTLGITVVPNICLCTEAGVLTPESLARLQAQIRLSQTNNPILNTVTGLLQNTVATLTGQVAATPATCSYPANSFPLCTGTSPAGCNFGCDSGFTRCNGACIPSTQVCPTNQARKRDQTSARICPQDWLACPVNSGRKTAWECVQVQTDLESCGGCAALGQGTDCTALQGVDDVSCIAGKCQANSCLRGFAINGSECSPVDTLKPRRIALLQ